jgi:hypothetical protein
VSLHALSQNFINIVSLHALSQNFIIIIMFLHADC